MVVMAMGTRYVVDAQGKPVAVLLDIEEYLQMLQRLELADIQMSSEATALSEDEWQARWAQFLARARSGIDLPAEALDRENLYDTRDVAD